MHDGQDLDFITLSKKFILGESQTSKYLVVLTELSKREKCQVVCWINRGGQLNKIRSTLGNQSECVKEY